MPPPRPYWPALSLMRLRESAIHPHKAGLALWKDWRGSCSYSALIPSVTERSALFLKELSFPHTTPTDDAFFNRNWAGACWNRWAGTGTTAGSIRWLWMLRSPAKQVTKGDRWGLARCHSDA